MVLTEAGIIQISFSRVPWAEDHAYPDKENMYKNMQRYLFMSVHTGIFGITMLQYRVPKNLLESGAHKTPIQYTFTWCRQGVRA